MSAPSLVRGDTSPRLAAVETPFGLNIGAMAAAALAAAGVTPCNFAGRVACETDYLAISGATFPPDVPREELEAFNRRTLHDAMSEDDEQARYAAIAKFWRRPKP